MESQLPPVGNQYTELARDTLNYYHEYFVPKSELVEYVPRRIFDVPVNGPKLFLGNCILFQDPTRFLVLLQIAVRRKDDQVVVMLVEMYLNGFKVLDIVQCYKSSNNHPPEFEIEPSTCKDQVFESIEQLLDKVCGDAHRNLVMGLVCRQLGHDP